MQNIKLDTGLQTYRINDACEVSFNPTDSGFVKRLYTASTELKRNTTHIPRKSRRKAVARAVRRHRAAERGDAGDHRLAV